jgi:hypothetical protein
MVDLEKVKSTYLSFVGSQLTTHAGTILGFSVLLFTSADLFVNKIGLTKVVFSLTIDISIVTIRYFLCWLTFFALFTGLFYSLMRLMYYGALAHEIIVDNTKAKEIAQLRVNCQDKLNKIRIIGRFGGGLGLKRSGLWSSVGVGFISSLLFFVVLFAQ